MKVCELANLIAIKANKYDIIAAKNWQIILVGLIMFRVKINTGVKLRPTCQSFCATFVAVYATLSHKMMAKTLLAPNHYKRAKILAHFCRIRTKIRELIGKFGQFLHFLLHFCRISANSVP